MTKLTDKELAEEAARWAERDRDLSGWVDAPEAVPRQGETASISMRVPKAMLNILREFARREGVGYQVLMKRWLDQRIREEAKSVQRRAVVVHLRQPQILQAAASFSAPDTALERQEEKHA
jgi:hypothetical protein